MYLMKWQKRISPPWQQAKSIDRSQTVLNTQSTHCLLQLNTNI